MTENNNVLKLVYTFFLGILLAFFIGLGINTFYAAPKSPEFPAVLSTYGKEPQMTNEQVAAQKVYDLSIEQHQKKLKPYNRNVSMIALAGAVILLVLSILYENKIRIIADGVMLGGLFTLLYSLGRGIASEDSKYMFAVVSVGLAVVLYLGYHRFVREHSPTKKSS